MTDSEIKQYLDNNNWSIPAQEGISKILNTSKQIIETDYDFATDMITLITPDNKFTFKWILNKIQEVKC